MPDETPRPDPEQPTGAEDPFDPVEPEDPFGVTGEPDPLDPGTTDPDPTTSGGIDIPPPLAAAPPGQTDTPETTALKQAMQKLPPLPDPKDSTQASRRKTWRLAQDARASLSDHWSMVKKLQLATAEISAARSKDPSDQAKLSKLREVLGTDGGVTKALDDWCTARDKAPADRSALATAAADLVDSVDALQKALATDSTSITSVDESQVLSEVLAGIVAEVSSEGLQVLAGERVSRGSASDVVTSQIEGLTRDRVWSTRLETANTWKAAGVMLENAIGDGALQRPVSKGQNGTPDISLNIAAITSSLQQLDSAWKAREADPADYGKRADVLRSYVGLAGDIKTQFDIVSKRQAELSNQKPTPGWDVAQTLRTKDLLAGMARVARSELSADPLIQDPDLARATRTVLNQVDAIAEQTSLTEQVNKAGSDLTKVWKAARDQQLKALKSTRADLGDLPVMLRTGLDPLLTQWSAEVAKFPNHDLATVKSLAASLAEQLQRYRAAVNAQLGDKRSSGLVEGLDIIAAAIARQIRSYDNRGGLFG